jgi:autotransporter-associated beta strand protein
VISGSGDVIKTGTGTLRLAGSSGNTYSGKTIVNAGTLELNKTVGDAIAGPLVVTLQEIAIVILRPEAALAIVIVFVALANLASEGQIEVAAAVGWYEFNGSSRSARLAGSRRYV